ncbi:MAG: RsmD family RNA methyltransferase [Planctomycetota bacterium]|nr:RsmD family RNA methyltransferase [Planctomycetota bacterium]
MRVLGGSARGVPLKTVPDFNTRPILDRLKKSLFSILDAAGLLVDTRILDVYAGTGTQGIEALSRGAAFCYFVERRNDAVVLLRENLAKTRLDDRAEVRLGDARLTLEHLAKQRAAGTLAPFDLVLYDPPFAFSREDATRQDVEAELALAGTLLSEAYARIVLRTEKKVEPPQPQGLALARHWTDGPHALCFYARPPAE